MSLHPLIIPVCLAALGAGYIMRWGLEQYGIDIDAQLRRLFGR